jgi:hypothetical protein
MLSFIRKRHQAISVEMPLVGAWDILQTKVETADYRNLLKESADKMGICKLEKSADKKRICW